MPSTVSDPARALTGETIELADPAADSAVSIVPARGAIVTSFRVGGRELLYLDEATLRDPTKNVRGGVPVLFPSPGRLTGDRFARGGRAGAMKQHGFARELPWSVHAVELVDGAAEATLVLEDSPVTRAAYPWSFRVEARFRLRGGALDLRFTIANGDPEAPMPFALGFHPYFLVHDKAGARIATKATKAFDNVTKEVVPFRGFDLAAGEVDMHLIDHGSTESTLTFADGARLLVRGSSEFTRWVVWTLPGKDFVCLEPWTAPGDALNTGESLLELAPRAKRELTVGFELVR